MSSDFIVNNSLCEEEHNTEFNNLELRLWLNTPVVANSEAGEQVNSIPGNNGYIPNIENAKSNNIKFVEENFSIENT